MEILLIVLTLCGQPQSYILNDKEQWIIFNTAAIPYVSDKYKDHPVKQVTLPLDYGNKDKCS